MNGYGSVTCIFSGMKIYKSKGGLFCQIWGCHMEYESDNIKSSNYEKTFINNIIGRNTYSFLRSIKNPRRQSIVERDEVVY